MGEATGEPVLINEVLASHTGTDNTEDIELFDSPGTNRVGLSLILVEGDVTAAPGTIARCIDFKVFHQLGLHGFFLIGTCAGLQTNYTTIPDRAIGNDFLKNSSLTIALVATASLTGTTVTGKTPPPD